MKRFALSISTVCLAHSAFAADLPSRFAPAPYYEPPPVFLWSGLYAGLNGQFGVGSFTRGGNAFGDPLGGLGGVTVGYNYQSGKLLVGVEGDIGFGGIGDSNGLGGVTTSGNVRGIGTVRARVGYVWDRALIYATGGYAGASLNGKVNDFAGSPGLMLDETHYLNGFAAGAGVEYAMTTRISVKGEYLFTKLYSERYFAGTRDALNAGAQINLVRLGVNYHF